MPRIKVKSYQSKNMKDYSYRQQMYADSLALSKDNLRGKSIGKLNKQMKTEYGADHMEDLMTPAKGASTIRPLTNSANKLISTDIMPTSNADNGGVLYDKPKQQVLPPLINKPSIAKLKTKSIKPIIEEEKLPEVVSTMKVDKSLGRQVTKVTYTPSSTPGYEKLKEYGTYSKNGEGVTVPDNVNKSLKYSKGSMGIKVKGNDGDLTGVDRKSRKATAEKMGNVAARRSRQIKDRSESGFKGETKNDHGLPLGGSEVIQDNKYDSEGGAKFRKEKYSKGTFKIKVKKKDA